MKRKLNSEISRFCPLPAPYLVSETVHSKTLSRRLQALDNVIAILDEENKFSPHVYRKAGKIDWETLESLPWTEDQQLGIQWIKTIWTESMQVIPREIGGLWPTNRKLKEAILKALAVDGEIPHVIDGYSTSQKPKGFLSFLTGKKAA